MGNAQRRLSLFLSLSMSDSQWWDGMGRDIYPLFAFVFFSVYGTRYLLPHLFSPYFPLLLFFLLRSRCLYSKLHHLHPSTHSLLPHTYELFIHLLFCKSKIQCHLSFWLVGFCLMHQKFNAIWVFKIKNYFKNRNNKFYKNFNCNFSKKLFLKTIMDKAKNTSFFI